MGCDCDRFIEVWNNVFTQFDNDGKGHYTELEHKNIDTGMGLERLAVVVQGVDSLFTVDTNKALLDRVCELAHTEYQKDHETDVSLRIVADHVKSCTFMISDGIMPSNEGRGYVLRRLLRRAARHGRKLGIEGQFMAGLAATVIELSKDGYRELEDNKAMIFKAVSYTHLDGSIGELKRPGYIAAENQTIDELKKLGKPFIAVSYTHLTHLLRLRRYGRNLKR